MFAIVTRCEHSFRGKCFEGSLTEILDHDRQELDARRSEQLMQEGGSRGSARHSVQRPLIDQVTSVGHFPCSERTTD